ncbi:glycosyltransferase [Cyanobacterium sp. Dongsha4]|uniref:glycosyltransferase n=1 Tax=Cyanobacterium sp. DS4 TaxID=2878255 RepID=UPI002E7FD8FD|nr:glycosyltransferase [Cyanobacterium sp. Dongsha4]WVK99933.1 glycosyltransferase [Cyanobacterium sp. Dongsha4]
MTKIHKILFFTSSLGKGGAEMHLLRLLNYIDKTKFHVSLALASSGGSYEKFLKPEIKIYHLLTGKLNSNTLRLVKSIGPLRALIKKEQPDIVCSVMDRPNVIAILTCLGLNPKPKLSLCVQNPPSYKYKTLLPFIAMTYPKADLVISLSQGVLDDLLNIVPAIEKKIQVIYNIGFDERVLSLAQEPLPANILTSNPIIVSCGRLTEQKDYPCLIEAFYEVRKKIPAELWILGEGKLKNSLEQQIINLDLKPFVNFLGFKDNPYKYIAKADVFALSSLYEGFGNVIVEAMACKTAVVSTNCPFGPQEIITNNVDGLVAPVREPHALANCLLKVLQDQQLKEKLQKQGISRAKAFSPEVIVSHYEAAFLNLINK